MSEDYNAALREAWDSFCDRIKEAGHLAFRKETPDSPLVRATGVRYMARYIAKAVDHEINFADPLYPQLWHLQTPTNKSFGDNPDCTYHEGVVDGGHDYRVVGNRGTVAWVSFKVGDRVLHGRDLRTEWDGSFVIELSQTEKPGNWIKLDPGRQRIFFRQFFGHWDTEEPMRIRVERVDAEPPPPLTPRDIIDGLANAAKWLEQDSSYWPRWVDAFLENPNVFTQGVPKFTGGDGNETILGRTLAFCGWRIQPDEALVIDVRPPDCVYWNFEMGDRWWNSVDYRYRLSSLNSYQAERAPDGSVWLVVSHQDPKILNWLDTGGNIEGSVNQRWVETKDSPLPRAQLVRFSELDQVLPKELRRIGPEERREQLRRRKIGVDRRFPV
jgi:hypothetical protein